MHLSVLLHHLSTGLAVVNCTLFEVGESLQQLQDVPWRFRSLIVGHDEVPQCQQLWIVPLHSFKVNMDLQ